MILLDTHVVLWLRSGSRELGSIAHREIDLAWQSGELAISAISIWEIAMLQSKKKITLSENLEHWRRTQIEQGIVEIPIDGEIGLRAVQLANFHSDPADRMIVATALAGHRLVTADKRILGWSGDLDSLVAFK